MSDQLISYVSSQPQTLENLLAIHFKMMCKHNTKHLNATYSQYLLQAFNYFAHIELGWSAEYKVSPRLSVQIRRDLPRQVSSIPKTQLSRIGVICPVWPLTWPWNTHDDLKPPKNVTQHFPFTMWLLSPHLPGTSLVIQSATWEISFEPLSLWPFSACQLGARPETLRGRAVAEGIGSAPSGIT